MFFETPANIDFAAYAGDNTTYISYSKERKRARQSQGTLKKMFRWFSTNNLVANGGTCQLLTSSKTSIDIRISNTEIRNEEKAKLLGVNLEGRLNFGFHGNRIKSN